MLQIYFDNPKIVLQNKAKLEMKLEVKLIISEKEISINGSPEDEFIAEQVIEALNLGFPFSTAILIKKEGYMLEKIPIKDYTKRKDLSSIRARIIGTKGKTLKTLCQLTKCFFELKNNEIAIIGDPECIKCTQNAIISIIKGTKTANVYAYLEKHQPIPVIDLGLKPMKKKAKRLRE